MIFLGFRGFHLLGISWIPAFAATTGTPSPGSTGDGSSATGQTAMGNDQTHMNGQSSMTNHQGSMNGRNGVNNPATTHIGQRLRADLSKAGFTDTTIMPSSFTVRAKDSQGNPVVMVINPDSVTAITEENAVGNSASNSNHAGANNGASTSTSPALPGNSTPTPPAKP